MNVQGDRVAIRVQRPMKGLVLSVDGEDGPEVRWSDNAIDVLPGDPQVVQMRGLEGKRAKVRAAYMGCERGRVVYEQ